MKKVAFGAKPQANKQMNPEEWVTARNGREDVQHEETGSMKRLTIDVSTSLHRRIKVQCAERDVKIADEVRALLEKHFPETLITEQ